MKTPVRKQKGATTLERVDLDAKITEMAKTLYSYCVVRTSDHFRFVLQFCILWKKCIKNNAILLT